MHASMHEPASAVGFVVAPTPGVWGACRHGCGVAAALQVVATCAMDLQGMGRHHA